MFQTNHNLLDERKVIYHNTCNYLFFNLIPLQQVEMRTLHSPNDVAPRMMNTMLGDNKNLQTWPVKIKVGGIR